jgi:hypothetical protein
LSRKPLWGKVLLEKMKTNLMPFRYGGVMFLPADLQGYVPSDHAEKRMAQRNVSFEDIDFVLEFGRKLHKAGAVFIFLRKCDIPRKERQVYERLEGTMVVLSRETNTIITVYRNRQKGLRRARRKSDRSRYPRYH